MIFFFFSSRRRHTRFKCDWSSDVCSSDLHIDSEEGIWNSGANGSPNQGHRPRHKEGYFPVPPVDRLQDLRSKIMLALIASGVEVEVHHQEVGTAGQNAHATPI